MVTLLKHIIASAGGKHDLDSLCYKTLSSGHVAVLPVGRRILNSISSIVRRSMNEVGLEISLPSMQKINLLEKSGRIESFKPNIFTIDDLFLAPTCEESITDVLRSLSMSYRDFPACFYQISTKYRRELRPRGGILRTREFTMKDSYSFHRHTECLENYLALHHELYRNIFRQLNLSILEVEACANSMCGQRSVEWHFAHPDGDDEIVSADGTNWLNRELIDTEVSYPYVQRCIEVGHTFIIGDFFSKRMNFQCHDKDGQLFHPLMGCYGLGLSRLLGVIGLAHFKDGKLSLPKAIRTFDVGVIFRGAYDDAIISSLQCHNYRIIVDYDTKRNVGTSMGWLERCGCRHIIVVDPRYELMFSLNKKLFKTIQAVIECIGSDHS